MCVKLVTYQKLYRDARSAKLKLGKGNVYVSRLRIHALRMLVRLCAESTRVRAGGGELFQVSLDPVVGLGSHICSKGAGVSLSVEESGVGQADFLKISL